MVKWLKHTIPALVIAVIVTALAVVAFEYDVLSGAKRQIFNAKLRVRGQQQQTGDVVIATIDNYSVMKDNLGRWPWPRSYMSYMLDTLNKYGAKVIAFDVFFTEPDVNVPIYGMRTYLRTSFERMGLATPKLKRKKARKEFMGNLRYFYDRLLGAEFERNPEEGKEGDKLEQDLIPDNWFEKSLARHNNIVLGYYFEEPHSPEEYLDDLNHAYKIIEADFKIAGVAIPSWIKNDKKKIIRFLKDLEAQEKKYVPYETLRRQAQEFETRFEKEVESAIKRAEAYNEELRATVEGFYGFCLDQIIRNINASMGFLVKKPDEETMGIIEENHSGMVTSVIKYKSPPDSINPFLHADNLTPNIPLFTQKCKHFGHVFVKPDPDGVIRNHMPAIHYGNYLWPSLSMKAASIFLKKSPEIKLPQPGQRPELKIGNVNIPLDDDGKLLINYFGAKEYPRYAIFDIIQGSIYTMPSSESIPEYFAEALKTTPEEYYKKEYGAEPLEGDIEFMITEVKKDDIFLATHIAQWEAEKSFEEKYGMSPHEAFGGKIVLVGATATGIYDLRVTPFSENTPGVEIHAQVIDSILANKFLKTPEWTRTYTLAIMAVFAVFMAILLPMMGAVRGAIVTIILLAGMLAVDYFYFFLGKGYWMPVVYQSLQLGALFILVTVYRYATEEREKRWIKDTFGRYLAPSVVEHLTENPDMIKLGGEKIELSAFFSDIQGFSTISEQLGEAEILVELLNDYLSVMAHVIESYEGTIDKYEGDSILAFWGAPVHFPDHAIKACHACLDQQVQLAELREKWKKGGRWPEIVYTAKVRMGINTGPMVVGNMGSAGRMNYTIMGDAVNLASRLEGANKAYGTYNMISEDTYAQVEGRVEVRELDLLRVVGKTEPVKVYELLARKGELNPDKTRVVEVFLEGLEAYKRLDWQKAIELFQTALNIDPEDMPSRTYLHRCRQFMTNPPPEDWDGVFTLTAK